MRGRWVGLILVVILALWMGIFTSQPAVFAQRATLPPTWTPTFTPTPLPTRTPTLPPTITPTLTAEEICDRFVVSGDDRRRPYYPYSSDVLLLFGANLPNTIIEVRVTHRIGGEGFIVSDIAPDPATALNIPIRTLSRPGLYDWVVTLYAPDETVLCERSGFFIAGLPTTPTPEAEVIIITAAPNVTVVTATPAAQVITATPTP